jgi:hypothetical protein
MHIDAIKSKTLMDAMIRWNVVDIFSGDERMMYRMIADEKADSNAVNNGTTKPAVERA